jgi:hypothetical protein
LPIYWELSLLAMLVGRAREKAPSSIGDLGSAFTQSNIRQRAFSMDKYQTGVEKNEKVNRSSVETPELTAAIDFILAIDEAELPTGTNLLAVRAMLLKLINGADSETMFGLKQNHRAAAQGFRKADIISAFIELRRRQLGSQRGALAQSKKEVAEHFLEFQKPMEPSSRKHMIERYWAEGRRMAEPLPTKDLEALLEPHKVSRTPPLLIDSRSSTAHVASLQAYSQICEE